MHKDMPKKSALKDLIKAMKSLDLEKVKGYKKADDDEAAITATEVSEKEAKKIKKKFEEEDED